MNRKAFKVSEIEVKNAPSLKRLDLKGHKIQSFRLHGLTNLEYLDLSDNALKDLSCIDGVNNLRTLKLRDNELSDMSPLKA